MKIVRNISALVLGLLMLGSCTLERTSYNEIYPENFYRNEEDVNKALTALYVPFRTGWGKFYCADQWGYTVISDFTTGMLEGKYANEGYNHFYEHWWRENGSDLGTQFAGKIYPQYNELSRIKNAIRNINNSSVSDAIKKKAIAEAQCLYGWVGYIMYDLFGPVPLITDEALADPEAEIFIPRLSDEEYTAIMIETLDEASRVLPEVQTDWGRTSKGMALMLMLKFHMINKNFVEAEKVARQLYAMESSGVYSLLGNYASVFDKANAKNKEIIHAIPCGSGNPNYWLTQVIPSDLGGFEASAWGTFLMQWKFYDSFEVGDDRLNTIITEYTRKDGGVVKRGSGNLTRGCIPRKLGADPEQTGSAGTTDCIVFRYVDVLLSLAECINENNGSPTTEAIELVNRVRNRVNLDPLTAAQTADKVAFNKAILSERLHEFYCEGLSRQDRVRHGVFVSNSQELFQDSQSDWYKVRFPIPAKFINESAGVVKQNPGYAG